MILRGLTTELKRISARRGIWKISLGLVVYVGLLLSYMAPVLPNCAERFIGGPGDETAFSWLYMASPDSPPLWGQTTWTNAPFGEDLHEPTYISGLVQYTAAWLITKVAPPNCAFNILMSSGFIFTAAITFLFIVWLTGGRSYFAAWFGGYLVAFSPYLTAKTPYHISYVFCGLLVAVLWLLMLMWKRKSYLIAAALMALTALIFYYDPYFILLTIVVYVCFFGGVFIYALRERSALPKLRHLFKQLIIVSPIFFLLVTPLLYTRIAYSEQISTVVKNSRDADIVKEGLVYGARPWEYIYPSIYNPLLPDALKEYRLNHQHGSNPAETTLYIGLVPIGLIAWLAFMAWRKRLNVELIEHKSPIPLKIIALVSGVLVIFAGVLSLLPSTKVLGVELHFPSELLLALTSMWRVPARLIVVVQIGIAILCAYAVILIILKLRHRRALMAGVLSAIMVLSLLEYLPFNPWSRSYWGYKDIPAVYGEIKQNPGVDRIAEYPMLDAPRNYAFIYYLTYQGYHRKQMVNSAKTASTTKQYRESMADLQDWQTLGVLKQLGVDRIVVHGSDAEVNSSANLKLVGTDADYVARNTATSYAIGDQVLPKSHVLTIADGFDGPSNYGYSDIGYYMHGKGKLKPVQLPGAPEKQGMTARIELHTPDKMRRVVIRQRGVTVAEINATTRKQIFDFNINTHYPLDITVDDGASERTLVISNMELN